MKDALPKVTYLKDYQKPPYLITHIDLIFDLADEQTIVTAHSRCVKNPSLQEKAGEMILFGEELDLLFLSVDGKQLDSSNYDLDEASLTLHGLPDAFKLEIKTKINPAANTALDGLYKSGGLFCTQNEPQGFRRITYFLDRPDVMARYTTKIIADKKKCPVLLSNGNLIDSGDLPNGKHWVLWEDPFPKPSYLYALVAGDLGCVKDHFICKSKRKVDLLIYCDKGNEGKCHHAMRSLKKSMQWDEEVFGLEYDLDIFMIVAVDAFNFGAMENKGLNIFNTSCVLADEKSATDDNFMRVEGVVAHEYFHNWTGNRVTCRDWFQLTLKEGLTVFRDQEFSADMNSRPVQRIEDVIALRESQFPEDEGPTSHPIQPKSYLEINNFYTTTIYNKGAEIIRMIQTLIGRETFRKGIDTYFELFDGQAVTTEDFLYAMEKASGVDLAPFSKWYHQSGTPELDIKFEYDAENKEFVLDVKQINRPTADQKKKESLYFPLAIALLNEEGHEFPLVSEQVSVTESGAFITISREQERFHFKEIPSKPVPSLNRGFSAPIRIKAPYSRKEYVFLMAHDSDPFNRWDAAQELAAQLMIEQVDKGKEGKKIELDASFSEAFGKILRDQSLDNFLKAKTLLLPTEGDLGQRQEIIEIDGNFKVREFFCNTLAERYFGEFQELYHSLHAKEPYAIGPISMGKRKLKSVCLSYMARTTKEEAIDTCFDQFLHATNMSDEFSALAILTNIACPQKDQAIKLFYDKWKEDTLVMCKWLSVQASSKLEGALERVAALMHDPVYDCKIPNLVRALLGSFVENHKQFHHKNGTGYAFIGEMIRELDKINPHVAARIAGGFKKYGKLDCGRKEVMKREIEKILEAKPLSPNVYEIISKCMG